MSKKYAIVNDIDCPDVRHVTQVIDGKHYYMSRALDENLKQYDGMTPDRPTFLEDFGFKITEREFQVDFDQVNIGTATYRDGTGRLWQGRSKFSLPKVRL